MSDTLKDNEQSLIAAMELLQEIKEEVLELSNNNNGLKEDVQILHAFSEECKRDIKESVLALGLKPTKSLRLLKNIHLYRSLAFQEIFLDSNGEITQYGGVFMNGHASSLQSNGSGRNTNTPHFSRVALPQDIEFIEVFGGHTTFYALPKEGNFIYVWGSNASGCAGVGHTNAIPLPIKVDFPARIKSIVCGSSISNTYQSALALCEDGKVYVTGRNATGQLGTNNTLDINTWTQNPYLSNIESIFLASTGNEGITLCIDKDGVLYTFGHNIQGACGNGSNANVLMPYKLELNQKVKLAKASINNVSHISSTSLILLEDGSIFGAGYNQERQLSSESATDSNVFIKLDILNGDNKDFIDIFPASKSGTCFALKGDGRLFGFGYGGFGFGSDNTQNSQIAHVVAEDIEFVVTHDRTNTRLFAKKKDVNSLVACGFNTDNSLGVGDNINTKTLKPVILPTKLKDFMLFSFNTEANLVALCEDDATTSLYACGTLLDSNLLYNTPVLQKQY
ncbi:RCC1 domain-containing protein [Helicobacter trogontum]|uniref:Uncharacterized protein n=1 Tax=Helicobacter trogontum TaxID=50960 RepID=A0A099V935_9HELI|nr:RCC1 domain-containing protein [Helicobacter trogontum]TLD81308.1 hypothetical protein LS81_008700 [Helicobacter trogontum]